MISVESTAETINLRISRATLSEERLSQLLRGLQWEEAVMDSQITEDQAEVMAEEMKADWWQRYGARFIAPPSAGQERGGSSSTQTLRFALW